MAAWTASAGATVFRPSGNAGSHLFVVVTDPTDFPHCAPKQCVLVPICTIPAAAIPFDRTVTLEPGCHPFVTNPSYIAYHHGCAELAATLQYHVNTGTFGTHNPVSNLLLQQIVAGFKVSAQVKKFIKAWFVDGLI